MRLLLPSFRMGRWRRECFNETNSVSLKLLTKLKWVDVIAHSEIVREQRVTSAVEFRYLF